MAFSNGYLTKLSGDCKNSISRQLNSQEITELLSSATKNSNLCLDFTDIDLTREAIELLANLPTKQYETI